MERPGSQRSPLVLFMKKSSFISAERREEGGAQRAAAHSLKKERNPDFKTLGLISLSKDNFRNCPPLCHRREPFEATPSASLPADYSGREGIDMTL